ncbi:MAG: RluA family pseudouridine synthase [Candidatus Pacebacteria bacterium]|nr:RluA family pseudouridine synthase [Candidatus Paceibacterota bacterium]
MNIEIIYEDKDIMAINKPPGVVVNEAKTVNEDTIQKWFWEKHDGFKDISTASAKKEYKKLIPEDFDDSFGTPEEIFQTRQGIVHRLDKETSGILLLAKNPGALVNLLSQFKKRTTKKKYLCLAHAKFGAPADTISYPIARSTQNRMKFRVDIEGREATTAYKAVDFYDKLDLEKIEKSNLENKETLLLKKYKNSYQGFSLVECWPKTGRTHQIRVHMAHIKHPLVGDKVYLGKKRVKLDPIWCKRHFLHASKIEFTHPKTGEVVEFEAELPNDLKKVLKLLKKVD